MLNSRFLVLFLILNALTPLKVEANDAAVETAAGGLVLRDERRVALTKERLYIGKKFKREDEANLPNKENSYPIVVEYVFTNKSSEEVTTQIAFPLPGFSYPWEDLIQDRRVHDFTVEVDGRPVAYSTQIRAKVGQLDVTELLSAYHIDIENFGFYDHIQNSHGTDRYQVQALPKGAQEKLKKGGALGGALEPLWSVYVTYYWSQIFPAGREVHIKHSYSAIPGFSYGFDVDDYLSNLKDGCFDSELHKSIKAGQLRTKNDMVFADWIQYILTTANTWAGPIADFELIVERPRGQFVSFCWDGKVEKLGQNKFKASATNFKPKQELKVYFFWLP